MSSNYAVKIRSKSEQFDTTAYAHLSNLLFQMERIDLALVANSPLKIGIKHTTDWDEHHAWQAPVSARILPFGNELNFYPDVTPQMVEKYLDEARNLIFRNIHNLKDDSAFGELIEEIHLIGRNKNLFPQKFMIIADESNLAKSIIELAKIVASGKGLYVSEYITDNILQDSENLIVRNEINFDKNILNIYEDDKILDLTPYKRTVLVLKYHGHNSEAKWEIKEIGKTINVLLRDDKFKNKFYVEKDVPVYAELVMDILIGYEKSRRTGRDEKVIKEVYRMKSGSKNKEYYLEF